MADVDDVLERLITEEAFRQRLAADPAAALAGYDLSAGDLALLATSFDDAGNVQRGVEQRTSKSALVGLIATLAGGGGAVAKGGGGDCNDADPQGRSVQWEPHKSPGLDSPKHSGAAPLDGAGTRFKADPYVEDSARADGTIPHVPTHHPAASDHGLDSESRLARKSGAMVAANYDHKVGVAPVPSTGVTPEAPHATGGDPLESAGTKKVRAEMYTERTGGPSGGFEPPSTGSKHVAGVKYQDVSHAASPSEDFLTIED